MTCEICSGTGYQRAIKTHAQSNKQIIVSVPCECFISKLVSEENKLLQHLGGQYLDLKRINPELIFTPEKLSESPNIHIQGRGTLSDDTFLLTIKSILIKHRFDTVKPRILFCRSIDIVQEYHVQQEDGTSLHLSSLSVFDLIILKFGTHEMNKALAPCLAQLVQNRVEEKRPIWIYYPDIYTIKREQSQELDRLLEKFKKVELKAGEAIEDTQKINQGLSEFKPV
jgi:hypothetical protein